MNENELHAWYEFDLRKLKARIEYLRSLLGSNIALAYAIKANPFLVKGAAPFVERLEICSPGESMICDRAGIPWEQTVISGVYKTPDFIESLVTQTDGRIYTVESMTQFKLLRTLSDKYQKSLILLLRLTNDSQFGINADEIIEIIRNRADYPLLQIRGIQFFSGTQKTSLKKIKREIELLDSLLVLLEQEHNYVAEELEYGPGFPVAYFGEELNEEALILGLKQLLQDMSVHPSITLELGRSIAACCGKYHTHIVDFKRNKDQNYIITDGGMHQMTYYGQFMGMKQPSLSILGKEQHPIVDSWNICGALCSMNDILVKQAPLPQIAIGDTLCFENAGAYCMTEGISLFLSRDLPAVYIINPDGSETCARSSIETYPFNSYK